jgi:hypothetical protein
MCGWCNRPELRDIDPTSTIFLCKAHQAIADRVQADINKMLVRLDQIALPAGYDRWPTGIITTAPPPAEPATTFALDDFLEFMRQWRQQSRPYDTSLEAEICMELQIAALPASPIELAIRIAAIARHHFTNRRISSTHTAWRVCLLSDRGGILRIIECSRPHRAEEIGADRVGLGGVAGYKVERQEHEAYEDGSHFTGPWITVTNTLEPTTEEPPCSTTSPG